MAEQLTTSADALEWNFSDSSMRYPIKLCLPLPGGIVRNQNWRGEMGFEGNEGYEKKSHPNCEPDTAKDLSTCVWAVFLCTIESVPSQSSSSSIVSKDLFFEYKIPFLNFIKIT